MFIHGIQGERNDDGPKHEVNSSGKNVTHSFRVLRERVGFDTVTG